MRRRLAHRVQQLRRLLEGAFFKWFFRQRWLMRALRRWMPVARLQGRVWVSRNSDVREVLERDGDFGVTYMPRMRLLEAPFLLGMNDSPRYRNAHTALVRAMPGEDLPHIARLTAERAARELAAAGDTIDVVRDLADPVLTHTIAEYLGIEPDLQSARAVFHEVFMNRDDKAVTERAAIAADDMSADVREEIAGRKRPSRGAGRPEDVLERLLALQSGPDVSLRDEDITDNLVSLVVAWGPNVSRAMALAVDELLKRPDAAAAAAAAARARDDRRVGAYMLEALRFRPPAPVVERRCTAALELCGRRLPAGTPVMALLCSAMWDGQCVRDPDDFRAERHSGDYLLFGHGRHQCLGAPIARVQLAAMGAALLRHDGLPHAGRLTYRGPFPASLPVAFAHRD